MFSSDLLVLEPNVRKKLLRAFSLLIPWVKLQADYGTEETELFPSSSYTIFFAVKFEPGNERCAERIIAHALTKKFPQREKRSTASIMDKDMVRFL